MIGWGLAAAVGTALVVALVKLGRYHSPAFHAAWAAWATRHGARYGENQEHIDVHLEVGHARVVATVGPDPRAFLRTSVHASWVLIAGPSFELADEGLEAAFLPPDWADVALGDAALDARFRRRAPIPDAAARALDARARELLATLPACALRASEHGVALTLPGVVEDHAVLDTALALVAHLAALDVDAVLAVLRELPGAEVSPPVEVDGRRQPLHARLRARGVTVVYTARRGRRVTVASARLPAAFPSGWFHIDAAGSADPVEETSTLPPALLPLLPGVGDSVLRFGDGRAELSMDGAVVDPERLVAAVDVCHALARSFTEKGAFR